MNAERRIVVPLAAGLLVLAAVASAQDGTLRALEAVARLIAGDPEAEEAVHAVGGPCVEPMLRWMLEQEPMDPTAWHVGAVLERMEGRKAVPALADLVRGHEPELRKAALSYLLARDDLTSGALVVVRFLLADPEPEMRQSAALWSTQRGHAFRESVPILLGCLKRHDVKSDAARALGNFPDQAEAIMPALLTAMDEAYDEQFVGAACSTLARYWHVPAAKAALIALARSDSVLDRRGVAEVLDEVPGAGDEVSGRCLEMAMDADDAVRRFARRSLRKIWKRGLGGHRNALQHESPEIRALACEAAGNGDKTVQPDLLA